MSSNQSMWCKKETSCIISGLVLPLLPGPILMVTYPFWGLSVVARTQLESVALFNNKCVSKSLKHKIIRYSALQRTCLLEKTTLASLSSQMAHINLDLIITWELENPSRSELPRSKLLFFFYPLIIRLLIWPRDCQLMVPSASVLMEYCGLL